MLENHFKSLILHTGTNAQFLSKKINFDENFENLNFRAKNEIFLESKDCNFFKSSKKRQKFTSQSKMNKKMSLVPVGFTTFRETT